MPDIPAGTLSPSLAAQIVAMNIPIAAASTIGIDAPTAAAGTTPMNTMPTVTAPMRKLGSPTRDGLAGSGAFSSSSDGGNEPDGLLGSWGWAWSSHFCLLKEAFSGRIGPTVH